jgi:hypothetical protein
MATSNGSIIRVMVRIMFIKYLAGRSIIWTAPGPGLLRFSGLGRRRIPGAGRDVIDLGRVFASDTAEDA